MKIHFEMGHPAHVHLFKNIIKELVNEGHEIVVSARESQEILFSLLEYYRIPYNSIGEKTGGILKKIGKLPYNDLLLLRIAKREKPDLFVGVTSPYSAHVSKLIKKPYIAFTDSEPTRLIQALTIPFCTNIITPRNFSKDFGNKHTKVDSFKELAYLHPKWYSPNPSTLGSLGIGQHEEYIILRFGAFDASHDIGIHGFSDEQKINVINKFEENYTVFISSEKPLAKKLEKYHLPIPPYQMHDALFYAKLLIGDTQTSSTESACLGTPCIRYNSFVGETDMSNFIELEQRYGLIFNCKNFDDVIIHANEILNNENKTDEWKRKLSSLLEEKIDLTSFMVNTITQYEER